MIKFVAVLLAFLYSGASMAASATVESLTGEVRASIGSAAPTAVTKDSTLESGTTVTTGNNGNVVMKFDDGQMIVLNANTAFKISQYHFDQAQPEKSSMIFSLFKGAMRSISGLIGKQNPGAYRLQTPVATIGIRGTDFMAVTGSLYVSVGQGVVSATNTAATSVFSAGQIGFVAGPAVAPAAMAISQLPSSVAASFSQLGAIPVTGAPGAASGSSMSNTGYGNTATSGATTSTAPTGGTTAGSGTTAGATTGSTTVAGSTTATAGATGGLATGTVAGAAAAGVAAAAALTSKTSNPVSATVTQ